MARVPEKFLKLAKDPSSPLYHCSPVDEENIRKVLEEFPTISGQYIDFIREIGWSENWDAFGLRNPLSGENFNFHPSAQVYNSPAGQALFPKSVPENPDQIWNNAIVFFEVGASWNYCFGIKEGGDTVFCLDFSGPEWTLNSADFYTFIDTMISD